MSMIKYKVSIMNKICVFQKYILEKRIFCWCLKVCLNFAASPNVALGLGIINIVAPGVTSLSWLSYSQLELCYFLQIWEIHFVNKVWIFMTFLIKECTCIPRLNCSNTVVWYPIKFTKFFHNTTFPKIIWHPHFLLVALVSQIVTLPWIN